MDTMVGESYDILFRRLCGVFRSCEDALGCLLKDERLVEEIERK